MPRYRERPPSDALARWVECVWCLEGGGAIEGYAVPPDGCIDIVIECGKGPRVVGAMTKQQTFDFAEGAAFAGVRFKPGMARSFLGISAAELTDAEVPLEDLGFRRSRELQCGIDDEASFLPAGLTPLFSRRLQTVEPSPLSNVQRAIEALTALDGVADLDFIARQAGLSPRQFRRRCLEESGLTPKHLCRILRFRHARRLAGVRLRPNWSAVAVEAGYFDQAHLIRDFREFTGGTPMAVFSNTEAAALS
jgi:AraC-like DNA-binding protein